MGLTTVSLTPPELSAEPGTSTTFTLEMTGEGAGAADLGFEVLGEAGEWAMVVPPHVRLPAGGAVRARVVVAVPRSPAVAPGPRSVTVRVAAAGQAPAEVHGTVDVGAFGDLRASLSPRASRGTVGGEHTLRVENLGNEAVTVAFKPAGPGGDPVVELDQATTTLAPGDSASVPVRLRARHRRLLGRPRSRPFAVDVRDERGGVVASAEGLLVQERLRWPVPVAVATALAAAAGWLALGRDGRSPAPQAVRAPTPAAVTTPPATCPPGPAGASDELVVQNFLFCPVTVTVARGSELRWTNRDEAPHTVSADDDAFDTGSFGRDELRAVWFDTPGTFTYFCRLHPFMRGTVTVM